MSATKWIFRNPKTVFGCLWAAISENCTNCLYNILFALIESSFLCDKSLTKTVDSITKRQNLRCKAVGLIILTGKNLSGLESRASPRGKMWESKDNHPKSKLKHEQLEERTFWIDDWRISLLRVNCGQSHTLPQTSAQVTAKVPIFTSLHESVKMIVLKSL